MELENRFKVLISAYACNPDRGSEWGVGWGWVKAISVYHDLWVITDRDNRERVEKKISERPERYAQVHFHYLPRLSYPWLTKLWMPTRVWTYNLWQKEAARLALDLHAKIGFDLVHLVTFVGFRSPGLMWKMDIPFVWGPIGGMENTKWRFLPSMGVKGGLHFTARNLINSYQKRFSAAPKQAVQKASGNLIAATNGIRREILKYYGEESTVICEIGSPEINGIEPISRKEASNPEACLERGACTQEIASTCSYTRWFGCPMMWIGHWIFWVRGPCTQKWQDLATGLGLAKKCRWYGWVPREVAMAIMGCAHIFVITSLTGVDRHGHIGGDLTGGARYLSGLLRIWRGD